MELIPDIKVGQMMIKYVVSDQYAATIAQIGPEKDVIYLTQYTQSDIRAKKNSKKEGYGEQIFKDGKWQYKDTSKYRHFSSWYLCEDKIKTILYPSF